MPLEDTSNVNAALIEAINQNDIHALEDAINNGANVNQDIDEDRRTPLHYAVMNGNLKAVTAILNAGAKITKSDIHSETPLHYAATTGKADIISAMLINTSLAVYQMNHNGKTPLHIAAENGHTEAVVILSNKGAAVNKGCRYYDTTPLYYAASSGHVEAVEVLLKAGAWVNLCDKRRETPLHGAAENGHAEAITVLLNKGARVDLYDCSGRSPLHYAAHNGHIKALTTLLNAGAAINQGDNMGDTPLHYAVSTCNAEAINVLIKAGAKVNPSNHFGLTPLQTAAAWRRLSTPDVIKALLAGGAGLFNDFSRVKSQLADYFRFANSIATNLSAAPFLLPYPGVSYIYITDKYLLNALSFKEKLWLVRTVPYNEDIHPIVKAVLKETAAQSKQYRQNKRAALELYVLLTNAKQADNKESISLVKPATNQSTSDYDLHELIVSLQKLPNELILKICEFSFNGRFHNLDEKITKTIKTLTSAHEIDKALKNCTKEEQYQRKDLLFQAARANQDLSEVKFVSRKRSRSECVAEQEQPAAKRSRFAERFKSFSSRYCVLS